MRTFYVLWDWSHYLYNDPFSFEPRAHSYTEYLGEAMPFESLCQAFEFLESSGLQLEVLRVEITSAWTPDLRTPTFPGTDELVPQLDDPRWANAADEIIGYKCYGIDPNGGVGRGVLNRHHDGYFYIDQYGGFEFGVSKVIISKKP
jgi:hypothetical protein